MPRRVPAKLAHLVSPVLCAVALLPTAKVHAADTATASIHELLANPAQLRARLTRSSPVVGAARSRVSQAESDASSTRLIPNPVLDASLGGIPLGGARDGRFRDSALWNVGVSETVELGKRGPRQAAADLRAEATRRYLTGTLAERTASARLAMANALHLLLRTLTLETSLHDAERATELERVRYEQKALAGMDYDRRLLELQTLEADASRSRAELDAALAGCESELFARCELGGASEEDLDRALPLELGPVGPKELARRPDLQGILLESDAARREALLARRRAIPDVTLRVGYTRDNSASQGSASDALSVGVTLPLPLSDRGQHDANKALARAQELEQQSRGLLATAQADVVALMRRKEALEHTLSILEKDSLPRARSVLESTQQAFDHGGISLTDFLLARRSYIALRLTLLEQRYELFTLRNDLYRVLGLDAQGHENDR